MSRLRIVTSLHSVMQYFARHDAAPGVAKDMDGAEATKVPGLLDGLEDPFSKLIRFLEPLHHLLLLQLLVLPERKLPHP